MSRIGDICFHASTYPTDGARSIMFLEVFFFLSGLPHNGVLPCRPFVARSCSHWLFFRLSGSQCWLTVHQYQLPSANWSPSMTGRSQRHPSDLMVILFRVCTCHIPKEVGPSLLNKVETGGQLVICLTVKLVTCFVYRILRILWRDHVSKAWIPLAIDLVTDWVHHPSFCTCMFVCWVEALSDCLAVDF